MPEHILIGPGNFGLGFAGDLFARVAGLSTVIITRDRKKKTDTKSISRDDSLKTKRHYYVSFDSHQKQVSISDILQCDFFNPSHDVISLFTDKSLKLITIAVPQPGLDDVGTLLANCLDARIQSEASLQIPLILTFVNTLYNGSKLRASIIGQCSHQLKERIKNKALESYAFPDCVIDRICSETSFDKNTTTVTVERYASLIVTESDYTDFLNKYGNLWNAEYGMPVLKQVSEILPWHRLKIWGLNGLHLLIASVARTPIYGHFKHGSEGTSVRDIAKDPRVSSLIQGFIAEVSLAIRSEHPGAISRDEAQVFLENTVERISNTIDTDIRLLQQLQLDEAHISEMLEEFYKEPLGPLSAKYAARKIIDKSIGDFLIKIDDRLLEPTFHLSGKERVYPLNLTIGTSCMLYAIANHLKHQRTKENES